VRRRASAVSNHEAPLVAFILRDAAERLLRMKSGRLQGGHAIACPPYFFAFTCCES
jgi:hypothetical protein